MADEFFVTGLLIEWQSGDENVAKTVSLEVDAVVETDFTLFRDGQANLSFPELCAEIERLGTVHAVESVNRVAIAIADGLMEIFPQIAALEITVRSPDPVLPEARVGAVGARLRRRRDSAPPPHSIQTRNRPRPLQGS